MDARVFDWEVSEETSPFKDMFKYSDKVDEIKEALHISKPDRFSSLNSTVASELTDRENDAASVYTDILSYESVPVLVAVGMFDMKDGVR
jgi:hypothetical protein